MIKRKHNKNKIGKPPGSVIYTGKKPDASLKMQLMEYNEAEYKVSEIKGIEEINLASNDVKWLNISGLADTEYIKYIGDYLKINTLILEDIVHIGQRPKIEVFKEYIFVVFNMILHDQEKKNINHEQLSFLLFPNILITFQEFDSNTFAPVKERIQYDVGGIRKKNESYLLYTIMDTIVDQYYLLLDEIEEKIEVLEADIMENMNSKSLKEIYGLRKELLLCKTSIWPLKDIINYMMRDEELFPQNIKEYFKDVNDHIIQIMDFVVIYREVLTGLLDTQLSNSSNRMNQIMTTLTVFSAIFIPLTFFAGVYGMNFQYMPELGYKSGYYIFWIASGAIGAGLYGTFRFKKWI
ncbi:MAG TPA: magnesium and cobalt transport protein CorA [Clostridiales bacterium]|nr:MAG: magnesium and cobalt transport protein CorA [Clostridiales bacterium GWD2_32_19]HCC07175.1 magnesium and cobalt transport protein CorA [Clostridiales bacterium]